MEYELGEETFIGTCALRFDGHLYCRETGFDMERADDALIRFFEAGKWNINPLEQLATFFLMQRRIRWQNCGFGDDEAQADTNSWRAYRTLFLKLCDYSIPDQFRMPTYYKQWQEEFAPNLTAYRAQVEAAMGQPAREQESSRAAAAEENKMEFCESEVIGACALRMDGYKFIEEMGFDVDEALDYFFRTGNWNATVDEQMAIFFIIQRAFRQPLEYEPKNGRYCRAYRELFLRLCGEDVPKKYRHAIYKEWQERYAPHVAEYVRRVGRIHKTTRYNDGMSVTDHLLSKSNPLLKKGHDQC
jgi:hypothetical protein